MRARSEVDWDFQNWGSCLLADAQHWRMPTGAKFPFTLEQGKIPGSGGLGVRVLITTYIFTVSSGEVSASFHSTRLGLKLTCSSMYCLKKIHCGTED